MVTGSIPVSATNKIKLTVMWAFLWLALYNISTGIYKKLVIESAPMD
jgi:hypothetical protein